MEEALLTFNGSSSLECFTEYGANMMPVHGVGNKSIQVNSPSFVYISFLLQFQFFLFFH